MTEAAAPARPARPGTAPPEPTVLVRVRRGPMLGLALAALTFAGLSGWGASSAFRTLLEGAERLPVSAMGVAGLLGLALALLAASAAGIAATALRDGLRLRPVLQVGPVGIFDRRTGHFIPWPSVRRAGIAVRRGRTAGVDLVLWVPLVLWQNPCRPGTFGRLAMRRPGVVHVSAALLRVEATALAEAILAQVRRHGGEVLTADRTAPAFSSDFSSHLCSAPPAPGLSSAPSPAGTPS